MLENKGFRDPAFEQVKEQDHGWPQNAGFRHILPKNGLQTRVLSIQASSSAEIRASKPENAIKQGVWTLQVGAILKDFKRFKLHLQVSSAPGLGFFFLLTIEDNDSQ